MISGEVAGLALSVAAGVIKLGRRLDQIMAEEAALRSSTAVIFPTIAFAPTISQMKDRLRAYLGETATEQPDPLDAAERTRLKDLLQSGTPRDDLEKALADYGMGDFGLDVFDANAEFRRALAASNAAWNMSLSDEDIHHLTYFVAAGVDHRENSLAFRIAATVVDVLSEFAAENARLVVSNDSARGLLEAVLRRFSKPDLATMPGWNAVLRHAVRATANGLLDARDILAEDREWLEIILAGIAHGRDLAPDSDDFIIGLFRGQGFQHLMRGVLEEGSARLLTDDAPVAQLVLGEVLREAAVRADGASGFDTFFFENWHALAAAGLRGLSTHGRGLLDGETPLLQATLIAAVDALAGEMAEGPPTGQTLVVTVEAMIAVVADDPDLLNDSIGEPWLVEFLGAVADTIRNEGLLNAFGASALERYVRESLTVMANHPEVLVGDSDLLRDLITNVLGGIAQADLMSLESIGDAAVAGALDAIAENADLIGTDFAPVLGDVAGRLAELVREKRLTRIQAADLIGVAAEVLATNTALFVMAEQGLAAVIVEVVLDASDGDEAGLLVGQALVAAIERILLVMSVRGSLVLQHHPLDELATRFGAVLDAALERAREELGSRLDRRTLPAVLSGITDAWARGELPEPGTDEFDDWFRDQAEEVALAAA